MSREYLEKIAFPPLSSSEGAFLIFDDFETELPYTRGGTATKYACYRSAARRRTGHWGQYLAYGGTAVIGDNVYLSRVISLQRSALLSLESMWFWVTLTGNCYLDFYLYFPALTGQYGCVAAIRVNTSTLEVSVWDDTGAWSVVGSIAEKRTAIWYNIFFEIDRVTGKYKSLVIGDTVIDVSAKKFQVTASVDLTYKWLIQQTSLTAENQDVYIDNILIRSVT